MSYIIEDGAVIYDGVTIGNGSIVRADSVVSRNVPPFCEVAGNPARIVRFLDERMDLSAAEKNMVTASQAVGQESLPLNCSLHRLGSFADMRGDLIYGCATEHLPFVPVRIFLTSVVEPTAVRGEHAHRTLLEFLLPVSGQLRVALTDGADSFCVHLDSPDVGLFIPTYVWSCQYSFSIKASLLVLASEPYDESSYIRSFRDFLALRSSRAAP